MPPLRSRTQMITVRLSHQEHEKLKNECAKCGDRTISDFVREIIVHRMSVSEVNTGLLTTDLHTLTFRLQELNSALMQLSDQIVILLGPSERSSARPPIKQCGIQEADIDYR